VVDAEADDAARGKGLTQPGCCLDAGYAAGHAHVHDHDIGRELPGQEDGGVACGGLADDFGTVPLKKLNHALPQEGVIVGDHNPKARQRAWCCVVMSGAFVHVACQKM